MQFHKFQKISITKLYQFQVTTLFRFTLKGILSRRICEAMKQAAYEAYESGKPVCERMKSVARAYRTHRKMPVQDAVTIALPELWLRKTCLKKDTVFAVAKQKF